MDPRFSPPGDGGNPQNALTGQLFDVNSGTTDINVSALYSKLRFWRNTRVASLSSGQSTTLDGGVGTLGYEWDVDADNGFRPAGLMDGLTPASPTTATSPPTTTITSPTQGATFSDGTAVTISGTATDAGGGVVAGVEVSTDDSGTWHPATTTSAADTSVTWSYSW